MNATGSEAFFDRLLKKKSRAFSVLSKLVSAEEEENQWRDFKEANWLRTTDHETNFHDKVLPEFRNTLSEKRAEKYQTKFAELRGIWSENLGAFANSDGGILIWGIKASKRKAEILSLAPDAEGFADWLREQQANATDPAIQGVRIEVFCEPRGKKGFVVCCIPRSTLAPHRSSWSPGRFFYRADDGNRELPAALLRRMFHPQVASFLVPHLTFTFENQDRGTHIHCEVNLENKGMASALSPLVVIQAYFGCVTKMSGASGWKERNYGAPDRIFTDMAIHPDEIVQCAHIAPVAPIPVQRTRPDLMIQFSIYAANTSALEGSLIIPGAEWESARLGPHKIARVVPMLQKREGWR